MPEDTEETVKVATAPMDPNRQLEFTNWREIELPGFESMEYAFLIDKGLEEMVMAYAPTNYVEVWKKVDELTRPESEGSVKDPEWLKKHIVEGSRAFHNDLFEKCCHLEGIVGRFWEIINSPPVTWRSDFEYEIDEYNEAHSGGYWGIKKGKDEDKGKG